MKHIVDLEWKEAMAFESELDGHKIVLDAPVEVGGADSGPRPKKLMLLSLAGCTGMDIVSILKKMKVEPSYFNVKVEAELTEEHPKHYSSMKVIYEFKGDNLPMAKLEKAVNLSAEKYCGVQAVYKKAMPVTSEIRILE